jgi:hypothetical protein
VKESEITGFCPSVLLANRSKKKAVVKIFGFMGMLF